MLRKPLVRRDRRLFVFAFPLCFHDQKGGDIHGKNDDLEALKAKFEELGAAITLK